MDIQDMPMVVVDIDPHILVVVVVHTRDYSYWVG
jgi:hypothetical protein